MDYNCLTQRLHIGAEKKIKVDASWTRDFPLKKVTPNGSERENPMKSQYEIIPQVVCDLRLEGEELEAVIAPGINIGNHNETFVSDPAALEGEELEAVIAPGINVGNHNETFVSDPAALE